MIVLELPVTSWEKFDAFQQLAQNKMPGITHDMIVSAWVAEMLERQIIEQSPAPTVEVEQNKLHEGNAS